MLVGDAITACGLTIEQPDGDVIVVAVNQHGKLVHRTAAEVADKNLGRNTYQAGGIFRPGSIVDNRGRKAENLVRIMWLAFDADLSDYLGWTKQDLWELDDETLADLVALQRSDLERIFGEIGLRFTRLDYTGYGLCGYLYLDELSGRKIEEVGQAYKSIVTAVNQRWGNGDLVDRSVSDAGTRITRIPGSINDKGSVERVSRTISHDGELYSLEQLQAAAGQKRSNVVHLSGPGDKRLDAEKQALIIEHMIPVWTLGQKHIVSLGLAGMLAKAGVAQEQALQIVQEISRRAGDERPDDRAKTVITTYKRLEAGEQTTGYFSLKGRIPDALLDWLDQELGQVRQASVTVLMPGRPSKKSEELSDDERIERGIGGRFTPPPAGAYFGWFAEYRDIMAPTTEAPDQFHLGAGLVIAGAQIGRTVSCWYNSEDLYGNLYAVLVGRTGTSRKDTAIKRALALPDYARGTKIIPAYAVHRDVSSAEGLIKTLKQDPNTLLYLTEMSATLKNARRKSTSTILDKLIEAWDTPRRMQNLSKMDSNEVFDPYVSILSATQPGRLARAMGDEEIESGFANRWLYVPGSGKAPIARTPDVDVIGAGELFADLSDAVRHFKIGERLRMSEAAGSKWDDWYRAVAEEMGDDEDLADMRTRHPTLVLKIALIHAVTDRSKSLEWRHIEPAMEFVNWSWGMVKQMMQAWGARDERYLEDRIISILSARGPLPKRQLQQACSSRKWTGKDFALALEWMRKNDTIVFDASGNVGLNGGAR